MDVVVAFLIPFAAGFGIEFLFQLRRESVPSVRWLALGALVLVGSVALYASAKWKLAAIYNWVNHGSYVRNYESSFLKDLAKKIKTQPK